MPNIFYTSRSNVTARPRDVFNELDDDAGSLAPSVGTSTDAGTIDGLGSLAGRMIQSFGEVTIRGVENVHTHVKLSHIESVVKNKDPSQWTVAAMAELLELQRYRAAFGCRHFP